MLLHMKVATGVALACMVAGFALLRIAAQRRARLLSARALIEDLRCVNDDCYALRVKFEVAGQSVVREVLAWSGEGQDCSVGKPIDILYNPIAPHEAQWAVPRGRHFIIGSFMLGCGVIWLLVLVLM